MKQSINFCDFQDAFTRMGRQDQYSYEGKKVIFDYLEELEESAGEEIELDVIAICCDFTEYESLEDVQREYNDIKNIDDLLDNTLVLAIDNDRMVIANF